METLAWVEGWELCSGRQHCKDTVKPVNEERERDEEKGGGGRERGQLTLQEQLLIRERCWRGLRVPFPLGAEAVWRVSHSPFSGILARLPALFIDINTNKKLIYVYIIQVCLYIIYQNILVPYPTHPLHLIHAWYLFL